MKIIHVVYSCVPGHYRGGIARIAYELAAAAVRAGHESIVLTTTLNSGMESGRRDGERITTADGVQIIYHETPSSRTYRSRSLAASLERHARTADVLHSHNTFLALNRYASQVGRRLDRPVYFHTHGALDPIVVGRGFSKSIKKRAYLRLLEVPQLNAAAGVIANTRAERQQVRHWGVQSPTHIVPNGVTPVQVDASQGVAARARFGIPDAAPVFLFVGRIVPKKGLHVLVDAVGRMTRDDVHIVIAGNQAQEPSYTRLVESAVESRGLRDRVHWAGFVPDSEKTQLMALATVFSHVTESEGMAMAALEAMASGIPTVVSPECYMHDAAGAGALVEAPLDGAMLADTFEKMLADPGALRFLARTGIAYASEHHDWDVVSRRLLRIYRTGSAAGTRTSTHGELG